MRGSSVLIAPPDGKWVVYNGTGKNTPVCLQKVSIEGGTPSALGGRRVYGARFSPDNKQIAAYDFKDNLNQNSDLQLYDRAPGEDFSIWLLTAPSITGITPFSTGLPTAVPSLTRYSMVMQ